jgi:uncharacterized protein (TIGR02001 family)
MNRVALDAKLLFSIHYYIIKGRKMKKLLLSSALIFMASAQAMASDGSVSGNIAFTTDYVFRGFSQTDENPALQGGFDYEDASGLHAGVWASNIDFNNTADGSLELDIYGGYQGEFEGVSYDVGGIYYAYPGSENNLNYDFWEAYVSGSYDFDGFSVNAGVNYSPEFFGDAGDAFYYYGGIDVALPYEVTLSAHYGHQDIDESADYNDWSVGVSRNWLEFDWSATYTEADVDNDDNADGRVVFSVGK